MRYGAFFDNFDCFETMRVYDNDVLFDSVSMLSSLAISKKRLDYLSLPTLRCLKKLMAKRKVDVKYNNMLSYAQDGISLSVSSPEKIENLYWLDYKDEQGQECNKVVYNEKNVGTPTSSVNNYIEEIKSIVNAPVR